MILYSKTENSTITTPLGDIHVFNSEEQSENLDKKVVDDFGSEWNKFNTFDKEELKKIADEYFDIVQSKSLLNNETKVLDAGCGSGRWSKVISELGVSCVEAIDPSDAVLVAQKMLNSRPNVRVTKASIDHIPFENNSFDFVMSIGVLHHIPDTRKALQQLVKKIKPGGYFYGYLYYNFENKGPLFKGIFFLSDLLRRTISRLPKLLKHLFCDILAILIYMPFVILSRISKVLIGGNFYQKIPLSYYQNKSFQIIRNDSLDRFGTRLEKRYSRSDITELCRVCGLKNVEFSSSEPYWHFVAQKPC